MRNLNEVIEELVYIKGLTEFDDLSISERKALFSYVLADPSFDLDEIVMEYLKIPQLLADMMNGMQSMEYMGDEIYDRFEDVFRPIINKKLMDTYLSQYNQGNFKELYCFI